MTASCERLTAGEVALARAVLYRAAAQALRHPGSTWPQEWRAAARGVRAALEVLALDGTDTTALQEAFDRCSGAAHDIERVRAGYDRWIGPSPRAGVTPYETEWTGAAGELLQYHQLADLSGFYLAFDLSLARRCDERVDHLAVELSFMQFLCAKEGSAEERGLLDLAGIARAGQQRFLREHLLRWAPACCARLGEAQGFLAQAAGFLRLFLESEHEQFGLEPRGPVPALAPSRLALADCCIGCSQAASCGAPGTAAPTEAGDG